MGWQTSDHHLTTMPAPLNTSELRNARGVGIVASRAVPRKQRLHGGDAVKR